MTTVEPFPGSLRTVMSPPMRRQNSQESVSPSPYRLLHARSGLGLLEGRKEAAQLLRARSRWISAVGSGLVGVLVRLRRRADMMLSNHSALTSGRDDGDDTCRRQRRPQ